MSMNPRAYHETEIKLYTPHLNRVQAALERAGAQLQSPRCHERNLRYENPRQDLTARGIVLRLRQDQQARLTYKEGRVLQNGISQRFEVEVVLDDLAAMDLILRRLGYRVALIYEKYRRTYTLPGAEIVLDEMPFGCFTEIEAPAARIEALLPALGLAQQPRMAGSYVEIFADVKARLGLTFRDLTFENFAGIAVPPSALGLDDSLTLPPHS